MDFHGIINGKIVIQNVSTLPSWTAIDVGLADMLLMKILLLWWLELDMEII